MSKRPNIHEAMSEAAGSTRTKSVSTTDKTNPSIEMPVNMAQPSRAGTKAITGHYPPPVRYQLKLLAAEQDRTMEHMLAEAINLLFAAYNKPEIAPTGPIR